MTRAHRPCAGWLVPCINVTHDCFLGCQVLCTATCLAVHFHAQQSVHPHPQHPLWLYILIHSKAFWQCIFTHSKLPGIAFSSPATLLVVQSHPLQPCWRYTVWSLAAFQIVRHYPQPPYWPYCCIHNHLLECTLSFKAMSSCSNALLHSKLLWYTFSSSFCLPLDRICTS